MSINATRKTIKIQARNWLFPLSAIYAALMLPLSVSGIFAWLPVPGGLQTALGHAHEMLFGLVFLVVSGYLLGPMPKVQLVWFMLLWLLARLAFLFFPFTLLSFGSAAILGGLLSYWVVPRFLRAKKWRNQSVAFIVLLFCLAMALASTSSYMLHTLLLHGLLVIAALMYFMGGRVIAPVLASHWQQKKIHTEMRVQPGVEGAGLISLAVALLLQVLGWWPPLTAAVLIVAGGIVWLRLLRWRPWQYWHRLDIQWLFFGYAALGSSLVLLGCGEFWPLAKLIAIHGLTVGAMGVLMVAIMARITVVKRFKDANAVKLAHVAAALLVLAAVLRFLAPLLPAAYIPLLHSAMLCWSLGFSGLLWVFWLCREP